LRESIESILSQTFTDFEYVLIDDGSTDGTQEIIQNYAKSDERIVFISKTNTGLTDSLNVGLKKAKGKWIARLDADDIAMPERLHKQYNFAEATDDPVLLGTGCFETDERGRTIKVHHYPLGNKRLHYYLIHGNKFFPHSSAFFLKDLTLSIGSYNPRYTKSQDRELWLRLSEYGAIACLGEPLIKLRRHSHSISYRDIDKMQYILFIAAGICHVLRKRGQADPSNQDDQTWKFFISWLANNLEQRGILPLKEIKEYARKQWYLGMKAEAFKYLMRREVWAKIKRGGFKAISYLVCGSPWWEHFAAAWTQVVTEKSPASYLLKNDG
jgi:glycosyltransferase involved in cell wall biosynthesis